jgi:predicted DNA-binding transcriptional regulator YafY
MERLFRLLICLSEAGEWGVDLPKLIAAAGFGEVSDASGAQLRRDLRHLNGGGWDIVNVAEEGSEARYVLRAHDNRIAVLLTPGERAALAQALIEVGDDIAQSPEILGDLQRATERHCLVHFTYKGTRRHVHPFTLHSGPSGWVLRGRETTSDIVKEFVCSRIGEDVEVDQPGSAEVAPTVPHQGFDPVDWLIDPPVDVIVATEAGHLTEVHRVLLGAEIVSQDGEQVLLRRRVTNRAAFWSRLYELGVRVRVVGPPELRAEVIADLRAIAGAA